MSKVVLLKCEEYDIDTVYNKLKWALEQLGGIHSIIPMTKKVLLKPNLVSAADPEAAVTTNPVVFEAVIKIMLEQGYSIKFGDSPGFGNPEKVATKAGLVEVARKYNIEQADFTRGEKISFPEGHICKQFDIANAVLETDAIINLPKMKSHALQRITGAIKNPFGCVIGLNKGTMHAVYPNAFRFAEMIIDLNNYLKVDLHIMDGIIAMEGNGPRNGNPVKMNVLLISTDPVALDTVFCKLIDLNPLSIPLITYGQKYGLGSHNDIEILGDDYLKLINKNFNVARTPLKDEDSSSYSFVRKHIVRRPYIKDDLCQKCGVCVTVCPLEDKAISFKDKDRSSVPIYDYSKCIRCYCCQEMCPHHAIEVKTPIIGKIVYGLKFLK